MKPPRRLHHQEMVVRRVRIRSSEAAARFESRGAARPPIPLLTRGRLWSILAVATAAAALFCVTFVCKSPLFAIRKVHVAGLSLLSSAEAEEVRAAARVVPGTNLLRLSRGRMEAAVKRVPAVADAKVLRRFPGGVDVLVTPRVPVAVLASGADHWEVDRGGIAVRAARPDCRLPVISCGLLQGVSAGHRIDLPGVAGALAAATLTARGKPLGVADIQVDQNGELCLNMVDSVAIRIGQSDQLDTKLSLLRRIYDERPDIGAEVEAIDLRFPEAPACVRRGSGKRTRDSDRPAEPYSFGRKAVPSELPGGPAGPDDAALPSSADPGESGFGRSRPTGRRTKHRSVESRKKRTADEGTDRSAAEGRQ